MKRIGYAYLKSFEPLAACNDPFLDRTDYDQFFEDREIPLSPPLPAYKRPALAAALAELTPNHEFIVCRLEEIGNSLRDVYRSVSLVSATGAHFKSLKEKIDTIKMGRENVFHIFDSLAQFENNKRNNEI